MAKETLQTLSTLIVTLALLYFAYIMRVNEGADTLSTVIVTAVVAKWFQQGAQQTAEKQAEKLQEAVANVTALPKEEK